MRRLSARQAITCEMGARPRCRCRCGGAYHGAMRAKLAEYFEDLAPEDPHQVRKQSRQLRLPPPVGSEAA